MNIESRIINFDALRLILSVWVMIAHYCFLFSFDLGVHEVILNPDTPVTMFFVLSGYLIVSAKLKSQKMIFLLNRIVRIYPAYLVVIAMCTIILWQLSDQLSYTNILKYVLHNAAFANFMMPSFGDALIDNRVNAINGSLWTLKIEVAFYVFVLMFSCCIKSRVFWVLIMLSSIFYQFIIGKIVGHEWESILQRQFPGQLVFFGLGASLYLYFETRNSFHALIMFAVMASSVVVLTDHMIAVKMLLCTVVLYSLRTLRQITLLKHDVSYTIYLVHFPIIQFAYASFGAELGVFGHVILVLTILSAAVLVTICVEKPVLLWWKKRAVSRP